MKLFFLLLILASLIVEYVYSYYKKDKIYSPQGTLGNLSGGIISNLIIVKISPIFITYFFLENTFSSTSSNYNFKTFLFCLLLVDFSGYLWHLTHHKINLLWNLHFVHHSDNKYNLSTYFRVSWISQIYSSIIYMPVIILGFNTIYFIPISLISTLYQLYNHSSYIKYPSFLNYIFITPQLHRIHHNQEIKHQNNNFGIIFSIWDRLFGTYVDKIDTFTPGIQGYHQDNFIMMQVDPIINYFKK